jgi:hypothetical protein
MMLQCIRVVDRRQKNPPFLDNWQAIHVRVNFPSVLGVLLPPFGIRGFRRSGFARRGEKIAKAIGRRSHTPFGLLVATGEFVS